MNFTSCAFLTVLELNFAETNKSNEDIKSNGCLVFRTGKQGNLTFIASGVFYTLV
jgi:hypothetical protein